MNRIAGSSADVRMRHARRRFVPLLTTLGACLLDALPIVMSTPLVPDFGFLVLIAWRLLRPELWTATVALPLGFFNDLVAGLPIGQSMALWTLTFLIFDVIDSRVLFRDFWMDWLIAVLAIFLYIGGSWFIGRAMGNVMHFSVLLPQIALSILAYPAVSRLVLTLDRWRLST